MRLETSPTQWNKIQDIIESISRETFIRSEKEEEHNQDRLEQTNTTTKRQNTREGLRGPHTHIINLSKYQLTPGEISLLSKGLNFIPTPKREHPAKLLQDIL